MRMRFYLLLLSTNYVITKRQRGRFPTCDINHMHVDSHMDPGYGQPDRRPAISYYIYMQCAQLARTPPAGKTMQLGRAISDAIRRERAAAFTVRTLPLS